MLLHLLLLSLLSSSSVDAKLYKKECEYNNVRKAYIDLVDHTGSTSKFKYEYSYTDSLRDNTYVELYIDKEVCYFFQKQSKKVLFKQNDNNYKIKDMDLLDDNYRDFTKCNHFNEVSSFYDKICIVKNDDFVRTVETTTTTTLPSVTTTTLPSVTTTTLPSVTTTTLPSVTTTTLPSVTTTTLPSVTTTTLPSVTTTTLPSATTTTLPSATTTTLPSATTTNTPFNTSVQTTTMSSDTTSNKNIENQPSKSESEKNGEVNVGLIVGPIVAIIVVIGVCIFAVVFKKNKKKSTTSPVISFNEEVEYLEPTPLKKSEPILYTNPIYSNTTTTSFQNSTEVEDE